MTNFKFKSWRLKSWIIVLGYELVILIATETEGWENMFWARS